MSKKMKFTLFVFKNKMLAGKFNHELLTYNLPSTYTLTAKTKS